MPATLQYSHNILKKLAEVRHAGGTLLEPDAKSQVTIQYEDGKPVRATSIVLSTQHAKGLCRRRRRLRQTLYPRSAARGLHRREHRLAHQSDRHLRDRRTGRRLRPDRAQDHRRHLRRGLARTAAVPSAARIRPRSTVRPPMPAATWPRTSWPPVWPIAAPSRSAMPSAWPSPSRSTSTCTAPARIAESVLEDEDPGPDRRGDAARDPRASGPEQADLCPLRRLWPFRSRAGRRRRLQLGKDRSGRSAEGAGLER